MSSYDLRRSSRKRTFASPGETRFAISEKRQRHEAEPTSAHYDLASLMEAQDTIQPPKRQLRSNTALGETLQELSSALPGTNPPPSESTGSRSLPTPPLRKVAKGEQPQKGRAGQHDNSGGQKRSAITPSGGNARGQARSSQHPAAGPSGHAGDDDDEDDSASEVEPEELGAEGQTRRAIRDPNFSWGGPQGEDCWPVKIKKGWTYPGQWRRNDAFGKEFLLPGSIIRIPVITGDVNQQHYRPEPRCYDSQSFPTPLGYSVGKLRFAVVVSNHRGHYISLPIFTYNGKGLEGFGNILRAEHVPLRDHRLKTRGGKWPSYMAEPMRGRQPLVTRYIWSGHTRYLHPQAYVKITSPISNNYDSTFEFIGCLEEPSLRRLYDYWRDLWKDTNPSRVMRNDGSDDRLPYPLPDPPVSFEVGNPRGVERGRVRSEMQGLPPNTRYRHPRDVQDVVVQSEEQPAPPPPSHPPSSQQQRHPYRQQQQHQRRPPPPPVLTTGPPAAAPQPFSSSSWAQITASPHSPTPPTPSGARGAMWRRSRDPRVFSTGGVPEGSSGGDGNGNNGGGNGGDGGEDRTRRRDLSGRWRRE